MNILTIEMVMSSITNAVVTIRTATSQHYFNLYTRFIFVQFPSFCILAVYDVKPATSS